MKGIILHIQYANVEFLFAVNVGSLEVFFEDLEKEAFNTESWTLSYGVIDGLKTITGVNSFARAYVLTVDKWQKNASI